MSIASLTADWAAPSQPEFGGRAAMSERPLNRHRKRRLMPSPPVAAGADQKQNAERDQQQDNRNRGGAAGIVRLDQAGGLVRRDLAPIGHMGREEHYRDEHTDR